MPNKTKTFFLKYGVPWLAVIVIVIHFFFTKTQNLNPWKGGGYGMYTGIHFYYNQIYIPGMSSDSLMEANFDIKNTFRDLKIMPNDKNLKEAAELILKITEKDSIQIQIWKPTVNSENGIYTRVLVNEIYLKKSEL